MDLDGTLWNTTEATYQVCNEILEEKNMPKVSKETIEKSMGHPFKECTKRYFKDLDEKEASALLQEIYKEETRQMQLKRHSGKIFPRVLETIKELSKNYKIIIVSNCNDYEYIECFINQSKTKDYITDYIPASYFEKKKEDIMKEQMEKYQTNHAVYLGDTKEDYASSHAANIPFIHAEYGFGKEVECPLKIKKIEELPELMKKIEENL